MATLLGARLPDAEKNADLFTWFCFEKVDEPPTDGKSGARVYRPNGAAFRQEVKLEVTLAPDETITAASLHVLRSFIDDPATCVHAADLVKSFVHYGDSPAVGDLAGEIIARSMRGSSRPVIMRGPQPLAAGPPSAQYDVFGGESNHCTLGNLTLENRRDAEKPALVVTLENHAEPQGWFSRLIHRAR